jgi:DNA-binding beta-propeller fold protein YncE
MVFDTARLMSGDGTPAVSASDSTGRPAGSIYAAISPDDKLLFVSDENNAALTVYDFATLHGGNTSAIGRVPVGLAPVGQAFSPDGRMLYSTSEIAKSGPNTCPPEGGAPRPTPQGELTVTDVTKAATDPAGAVLARIPAGCDPVRVALAPNGRLFTTTRGDNAVQVFDTAKLASGSAMIAKVAVGNSPVGVTAAGDRVFAANSNRFALAGRSREWLSVIDARTNAVEGAVPAGLFPRELKVTPDGKTLLVTNFNSKSLELVDLARLTGDYFAQQQPVMTADLAGQASANAAIQTRIKSKTPSPGTEAAVRDQIENLEKGQMNYAAMTPELADVSRPQGPSILKNAAQWGALKSLTLDSITPQGMDLYDAEFEHASIQWGIGPLTPDGKISMLFFRPKT